MADFDELYINGVYVGTFGGGSGGTVSWGDIQNKPTAFPPSQHTHDAGDIDGTALALTYGNQTLEMSAYDSMRGYTAITSTGGLNVYADDFLVNGETPSYDGHTHTVSEITDLYRAGQYLLVSAATAITASSTYVVAPLAKKGEGTRQFHYGSGFSVAGGYVSPQKAGVVRATVGVHVSGLNEGDQIAAAIFVGTSNLFASLGSAVWQGGSASNKQFAADVIVSGLFSVTSSDSISVRARNNSGARGSIGTTTYMNIEYV